MLKYSFQIIFAHDLSNTTFIILNKRIYSNLGVLVYFLYLNLDLIYVIVKMFEFQMHN